ncbi:short-subunit dehydrogenase [Halopolyspora algeriensis]|uniref:Short-subunit dehydrogenase n=1 Tax=Halopolyspora algeriensis TaxID=1500506 RepID=A0A368VI17_9ACTN|nr:SDR family oxidoreductase [Halopolyspora algeriensis]RCW41056.1 short-subunit dehydrogenase [Halopolyspora algeriensis]TQM53860.1 short-subunit dehydrogenase [Halopolyspora algeriensis]
MPRKISESVVVLTGASSGIARAAALALAERGARVVLAARSEESLRAVVVECERAGGRALAVPTDVTDQDAVNALAERAVETFGRIDVWINCAAVIAFGEFEKTPAEVYRRVIETNLFGTIHGARAVLPHFRRQRSGVLINVDSVWGSVSSPYVTPYVTSKFGVRAFSESLREAMRLEPETRDVHVCMVLPQSVDTPIFQHAATYTERRPKAIPPIVGPGRVVRSILRSIEHPRRQRTVATAGHFLEFVHAALPSVFNRAVPKAMNLAAFSRERVISGPGNLFEPMPEWNRVQGGWRRTPVRIALGAGAATAAVGAALAAARSIRRC